MGKTKQVISGLISKSDPDPEISAFERDEKGNVNSMKILVGRRVLTVEIRVCGYCHAKCWWTDDTEHCPKCGGL